MDDETKLTLHGLQQHYLKLEENAKNRKLNDLLDNLEFNQVCRTSHVWCAPMSKLLTCDFQVVIFVRSVARATQLDSLLRECNFPSISIHSGLGQEERIKRYQQFKSFEKRILVATDIFGRGIDVVRVFGLYEVEITRLMSIFLLGTCQVSCTPLACRGRTSTDICSLFLASSSTTTAQRTLTATCTVWVVLVVSVLRVLRVSRLALRSIRRSMIDVSFASFSHLCDDGHR